MQQIRYFANMIHASSKSAFHEDDDLSPADLVPVDRRLSAAERFWAAIDAAVEAPTGFDAYEDAPTEEVPIVAARPQTQAWSHR
jgi:hypothetical protein